MCLFVAFSVAPALSIVVTSCYIQLVSVVWSAMLVGESLHEFVASWSPILTH